LPIRMTAFAEDDSPSSLSATARSDGVVIFRLRGSPSTIWTACPACSASIASSVASLASANASVDTPEAAAFAVPYRDSARVVWHDQTLDLAASCTGSNAKARAPPFPS